MKMNLDTLFTGVTKDTKAPGWSILSQNEIAAQIREAAILLIYRICF